MYVKLHQVVTQLYISYKRLSFRETLRIYTAIKFADVTLYYTVSIMLYLIYILILYYTGETQIDVAAAVQRKM